MKESLTKAPFPFCDRLPSRDKAIHEMRAKFPPDIARQHILFCLYPSGTVSPMRRTRLDEEFVLSSGQVWHSTIDCEIAINWEVICSADPVNIPGRAYY